MFEDLNADLNYLNYSMDNEISSDELLMKEDINIDTKGKFKFSSKYIVIYIIINMLVSVLIDIDIYSEHKISPLILDFQKKSELFMNILGMFFLSLVKSLFLIVYYCQEKSSFTVYKRISNNSENGKIVIKVDEVKGRKSIFVLKKGTEFNAVFLFIICSGIDFMFNFLKPFKITQDFSLNAIYFYDLKFILLITFVILLYFIFHFTLYKHHILSIILFTTGFVLLLVFTFDVLNLEMFELIIPIEILIALQLIIENWLIEKDYMSLYLILGIEGLIELIMTILTFIICFFTNKITLKFEPKFSVLIYALNYLINFISTYFKFIVFLKNDIFIYLCSEISSVGFYDYFQLLLVYILGVEDFDYSNFLSLIPDTIFIFSMLVLSEIVVLKCFGLDENTRENIEKRAMLEPMK